MIPLPEPVRRWCWAIAQVLCCRPQVDDEDIATATVEPSPNRSSVAGEESHAPTPLPPPEAPSTETTTSVQETDTALPPPETVVTETTTSVQETDEETFNATASAGEIARGPETQPAMAIEAEEQIEETPREMSAAERSSETEISPPLVEDPAAGASAANTSAVGRSLAPDVGLQRLEMPASLRSSDPSDDTDDEALFLHTEAAPPLAPRAGATSTGSRGPSDTYSQYRPKRPSRFNDPQPQAAATSSAPVHKKPQTAKQQRKDMAENPAAQLHSRQGFVAYMNRLRAENAEEYESRWTRMTPFELAVYMNDLQEHDKEHFLERQAQMTSEQTAQYVAYLAALARRRARKEEEGKQREKGTQPAADRLDLNRLRKEYPRKILPDQLAKDLPKAREDLIEQYPGLQRRITPTQPKPKPSAEATGRAGASSSSTSDRSGDQSKDPLVSMPLGELARRMSELREKNKNEYHLSFDRMSAPRLIDYLDYLERNDPTAYHKQLRGVNGDNLKAASQKHHNYLMSLMAAEIGEDVAFSDEPGVDDDFDDFEDEEFDDDEDDEEF